MKLSVLALDYDGTIATTDTLAPCAREAIAAARASGILVLLVTGRILDDLRALTGDLHFVDGVVAENGGVVHFPDSEYTSVLAPPTSTAFLEELRRRGIPHRAGHSLVDAEAVDGAVMLDVIRALELPLVLVFNRSRVMGMSQGVSKATGLRTALDVLRASARNTVAIGDAENDHELLRLAEVGIAVEWGCPSLRAAADMVLHGTGPGDVARQIRALAEGGRLPVPERARRRLRLGFGEDGREFSLAVRGRNILVTGDARSGKSWMAGLLSEQLILHGYSLCVIDPEGDYRALEGLPGVAVLGGSNSPPPPSDVQEALRYPDRSVVIDLSHQRHDAKVQYVRALLPGLSGMRRRTGLPHRIVIDEAHHFLHESDAGPLIDLTFNGYIVVTYCASRLPATLRGATEVVIATCESDPAEIEGLHTMCACGGCGQTDCACWCQRIRHLRPGQAAALPMTSETEGEVRVFTMARRLTPHVRHREKYGDVPVAEDRAFVFEATGQRASTLRAFVSVLSASTSEALAGHLRRGDFSRWIRDVFGDHALAAALDTQEARYRIDGDADAVPDIVNAVRSRYDLDDTPAA